MRRFLGRCIATTLLLSSACTTPDAPAPTDPNALDPAFARPGGAPSITITTLPALGSRSSASSINDAEEIAGTSGSFPVRWSRVNGAWTVTKLGAATGFGVDINEAGTVLASASGTVTVYRRNASTATVASGSAVGLNEAETVVGIEAGSNLPTAWTASNGTWTAHHLVGLNGPGDTGAYASGINDAGVIVGYQPSGGLAQRAIVWRPSTINSGEWSAATTLDVPASSTNAAALAIEGNRVVGLNQNCTDPSAYSTCGPSVAYAWSVTGTGPGSLSSANSQARGLNSNGAIVGIFFPGRLGYDHAFVWTETAPTLRDLGMPKGYSDASAYDINNPAGSRTSREAVGQLADNHGSASAALWTIP